MLDKIDKIQELLNVPNIDSSKETAITNMKILNLLVDLRAEAEQLILPIVSNQRELLNAFAEWLKKDDDHNLINKYTVDAYLESI